MLKTKRFHKGDHTIYHGDVLDVLKEIKNRSVDLIFADPPYNIGKNFNGRMDKWTSKTAYIKWVKAWLDLALLKLKDNGSLYVMMATQFQAEYDIYLSTKMQIMSRIIWAYDSSGVQAKTSYGSLYEPILYCVKDSENYVFNADDIMIEARTGSQRRLMDYRSNPPKPYNSKKLPGNVWQFNRVRYRMKEYEQHPTQKPQALLERIIKASSNKKQMVLDLFAGTFTTSSVAKQLGRKSIAIEIDEKFVKIGLRRLEIRQQYKNQKLKAMKKPYIRKNSKGSGPAKIRSITRLAS
jgi:adenine-specific DNA-methyltransferase